MIKYSVFLSKGNKRQQTKNLICSIAYEKLNIAIYFYFLSVNQWCTLKGEMCD